MSDNFSNLLNDLLYKQVTYNYIPKIENKEGIDIINFIAELKTIEKGNSFRYAITGFNILYFYLLLEQKFYSLKKFKFAMILILPIGIYTYGILKSRRLINKIIDPLFKDEFEFYKTGKLKSIKESNSNKDNYNEFLSKILKKDQSSNYPSFIQTTERYKLSDHIKYITEWLYEPVDLDFENKLYFIKDSESSIDKDFAKSNDNQYLGLRYKKI